MPHSTTQSSRPYAALLRVSGKRQVKEETIEVQRQGIRIWLERRGVDPDADVYWFEDADVSGDVPIRERPGAGRLLALAEAGVITEGVVVYKINRAVREDLPGYLELEFACSDNGLTLYATQDVIDTSTPFGRTMARMRAVLADDEKRELVRRLADAKRARARMGRWQTRPPYGWVIGEDKRLHLHPTQSAVIREMVRLLLTERLSVYAIADNLTNQGIPSPQGLPRWDYSVIAKMLRNPLLKGEGRYNTTQVVRRKGKRIRQVARPDADHIVIDAEPLLDRLTFQRVQDALGINARLKAHSGAVIAHFWLANLVKCNACGRTYNPQRTVSKHTTHYYYRHAHKRTNNPPCAYADKQIPRDMVEAQTWQVILQAATDPAAWRKREAEEQPPQDAARLAQAAQAVKDAESKLADLEDSHFVRGTTSAARYDSLAPRLNATLNLARRALLEAQSVQAQAAERAAATNRAADELARYRAEIEQVDRDGSIEAKREIALAIVRRVVILDYRREKGSRYGTPLIALRVDWKG